MTAQSRAEHSHHQAQETVLTADSAQTEIIMNAEMTEEMTETEVFVTTVIIGIIATIGITVVTEAMLTEVTETLVTETEE